MKLEVNPKDISLVGIWVWWWAMSRKPGTGVEVPPMPPLSEWPKELVETFERVTGVSINDAEFYVPPSDEGQPGNGTP